MKINFKFKNGKVLITEKCDMFPDGLIKTNDLERIVIEQPNDDKTIDTVIIELFPGGTVARRTRNNPSSLPTE